MGEDHFFLLKHSWSHLKVYRALGIFPCQRIKLEDGTLKLTRLSIWKYAVRLALWFTLTTLQSTIVSMIFFGYSDFSSYFESFAFFLDAMNRTTTDTVTATTTILMFGLIFNILVFLNYGLVGKMLSVADVFDTSKRSERSNIHAQHRARQMSSNLLWFYL